MYLVYSGQWCIIRMCKSMTPHYEMRDEEGMVSPISKSPRKMTLLYVADSVCLNSV